MSDNIIVPENIVERKIIVYKPRVDINLARATAEKMKIKLFRRFGFMKPKSEEVQIFSIERYYEPYVFVDGKYVIDYSIKWIHNIQVDQTMQELTIYGEKVRPNSLKGHLNLPCKILQLNGISRFKHEINANIIFDKDWNEVGTDHLPFLPFEEHPERILETFNQNSENPQMFYEKEIEILKSRIVKRPPEILTIHNELFQVSQRAEIYRPMYNIVVLNIKTKKKATIFIDAITGKTTFSQQPTSIHKNKDSIEDQENRPGTPEKVEDELSGSLDQKENEIDLEIKI